MNRRPDTGLRVLVATIALIAVLGFACSGHGVWDFAQRPLP